MIFVHKYWTLSCACMGDASKFLESHFTFSNWLIYLGVYGDFAYLIVHYKLKYS